MLLQYSIHKANKMNILYIDGLCQDKSLLKIYDL